jgi:hypothetical protein
VPENEYTYDPSRPGTRQTGLDPPRRDPPDVGSINADQVNFLMALKTHETAENTAALEAAYIQHENVMRALDLAIKFLERVADTPELERLLLEQRALRETADRLLFTGGAELRRDESTMTLGGGFHVGGPNGPVCYPCTRDYHTGGCCSEPPSPMPWLDVGLRPSDSSDHP